MKLMDNDLVAEIDVLLWIKACWEVEQKQADKEAEAKRKLEKEAERKKKVDKERYQRRR
jgi:hypothetical protein